MDEPHALLAIRYIERNPDRAGLAARPEAWPWSSARSHLGLGEDPLTMTGAVAHLIPDWQAYLDDLPPSWQQDALRQSTGTGRPLGSVDYIRGLEHQLDRKLRP